MRYVLENDELRVEIDSFGAELKSVKSKTTEQEYMWQADPKFWGRQPEPAERIRFRLQTVRRRERPDTPACTIHPDGECPAAVPAAAALYAAGCRSRPTRPSGKAAASGRPGRPPHWDTCLPAWC